MGYPFQGSGGGGGGTSWSEYTQTYATADATHAARTAAALTDSSGGAPSTTIPAIGAPTLGAGGETVDMGAFNSSNGLKFDAIQVAIASLAREVGRNKADSEDTAKIVNKLIDDTQA